METQEILRRFEVAEGLDRAAVEAAIERREEITPHLLGIVEDAIARAREVAEEDWYVAHFYAIYLLAQFRETRAYPLLLRLAYLPDDLPMRLWGDFITGDLARVLASVCGGELDGIKAVIEDEQADIWVRGAALESLQTLVATGQKSRDEIVGYFAGLFRGRLRRAPSDMWDCLASACCQLRAAELREEIEQAFREDLIDPGMMTLESFETAMKESQEAALASLARGPLGTLVDDAVRDLEWMADDSYDDIYDDDIYDEEGFQPFDIDSPWRDPSVIVPGATVRRAVPKVGRNEPCPCGSGKKYKRCCGK